MITSRQVNEVLVAEAPRGQWLKTTDIYALVERHLSLSEEDNTLIAGKGRSTRWHRVVRNTLQRLKVAGEIEWERGRGFRLRAA
jgi:hypothetical protein